MVVHQVFFLLIHLPSPFLMLLRRKTVVWGVRALSAHSEHGVSILEIRRPWWGPSISQPSTVLLLHPPSLPRYRACSQEAAFDCWERPPSRKPCPLRICESQPETLLCLEHQRVLQRRVALLSALGLFLPSVPCRGTKGGDC